MSSFTDIWSVLLYKQIAVTLSQCMRMFYSAVMTCMNMVKICARKSNLMHDIFLANFFLKFGSAHQSPYNFTMHKYLMYRY